jgi:iron complex transport system substrate-binding protein
MKRSWMLPAILALTIALTACGGAKNEPAKPSAPAATKITVKDDKNEITLEKTPTKVVAISLQAIDSLIALGVKPVGVAEQGAGEKIPYLGNALDGIPVVGLHSKPNLETIAALQPDLIIVDPEFSGELYPELAKIAPTLQFRSSSVDKTMADLKAIGKALGKEAEANKFVADFEAKRKALTEKAKGKTGAKWMAIFGTTDKPGVWLPNSFVGSILTGLNAPDAYTGAPDPKYPDFAYLSLEKITALNPEIFLLMSTPGKELSKGWSANPAYAATTAVKNGKVFEVNRNLWSRSRGPIAAVKIMEEAFPLLYPDVK